MVGEVGFDARHQVHHVAVVLDLLEARHPHGAGHADPADVVAAEVDQHHVLGPFLGVGGEVFGEPAVAFGVDAARPGAGDRPGLQAAAGLAHQHLGRGADQGAVGQLEQHHVGAGVDHPQGAVEGERARRLGDREAAGQHHLEDVAGADVFLGLLDRGAVGGAVHARRGLGRTARRPGPSAGRSPGSGCRW